MRTDSNAAYIIIIIYMHESQRHIVIVFLQP